MYFKECNVLITVFFFVCACCRVRNYFPLPYERMYVCICMCVHGCVFLLSNVNVIRSLCHHIMSHVLVPSASHRYRAIQLAVSDESNPGIDWMEIRATASYRNMPQSMSNKKSDS